MPGPLEGLRILEFEAIGPGPYCAMLLADLGAEVLRLARPDADRGALIEDIGGAVMHRGRPAITLDLKAAADLALARRLIGRADALVEGLRPGAMERLGLGPEPALALNPRLVYGRVTGWGQEGPLARSAGHDINYIALSGALAAMGPPDGPPLPPLNLVGDFGGGGLFLAFGMLAALIEAGRSGRGQVVDAAMLDGAASQMALIYAWAASGRWHEARGTNLLDGGAPFYRTYACADGGFVAVGAIEPAFYAEFLDLLELDPRAWPQHDRDRWPAQRATLAEVFATRPRDEWAALFEGSDACVVPVLSLTEAPAHPHLAARGTFTTHHGLTQPAPAPRFSRTPGSLGRPPATPGRHTDEILEEVGYSPAAIAELRDISAVR